MDETEQLYIYKDPVYTGSAATIGAYKYSCDCQLTAEQLEFNALIVKKRVAVEQGFGYI
jgi:hypothetical protein